MRGGRAARCDTQAKKPRFPLRVVATGEHPVVRFLGYADQANNAEYLEQWCSKIHAWCDEGASPYFFMHTAGNDGAPEAARKFVQQVTAFGHKKGLESIFLSGREFLGEIEASAQPALF